MWRARVAFYAWLGILAGHGTAASRPESGDGVVRFVYVDPAASEVYLVGDFNGWSPSATPLDPEQDGAWVALVFMDPGTYEYKFLVDGSWRLDPDNPEVSPNGNSMVRVGAGGAVLSSGVTGDGVARTGPGSAGTGSESLRWFVRYLGLFTSRRDRETQRYDLDRPTHDVDLRLEVEFGHDVTGWFLTNFNNLEEGTELSRTSLRYDRGMVLWRPGASAVRFFDNVGVTDFADPGALVGRVGIYADAFGFGRRGVVVRRRILGAPLELVYADDTEPGTGGAPETALPALHAAGAGALAGRTVQRYVASTSDRNADALALRFRAGTADEGLGFGYRLDRGAAAGRLSRVAVRSDSLGLVGAGREFETTEDWQAWNLDLRLRGFGARLIAEYMSGNRVASATRVTRLEEVRADTAAGTTQGVFGRPVTSDEDFDLDDSRRVVLRLAGADGARAWIPQLTYEYQENDFSALVTGTPFLMRRHGLELGVGGRLGGGGGRRGGVEARLDVEHSWFDYPSGSTWETQFWFRRHNFWLDEDTASFHRLTLLGADRAGAARIEAAGVLWPRRDLRGSLRFTWSSPGFDRAPRYLETVLRLSVPLTGEVELRTHSRLATYRRFETSDADVVALLGPGHHVEAGVLGNADFADAEHDYRTFAAHFVELVYALTSRSDVALGFGVDPYVVYEVRNEYMDIGWDQFLFAQGAAPASAFLDPVRLGDRIENAERRLERERRLTLEARVRF